MTTQNISGIGAARRANAATADSAVARARILAAAVADADRTRTIDAHNADVTARAIDQTHIDTIAGFSDELDQVGYVMTGAPLVDPAAATAAAVPPVAEPVTPPMEPATAPAAVAPPVAAPAATPTANATALAITGGAVHHHHNRPNTLNTRRWPWGVWWLWVLLVAGLLGGLLISSVTWGLFVQDWYLNHGPKWLVAGIVLSIIHWIFFPVAGFLLGGAIASGIANYGQNEEAAPAVPPIPAPAQPVAAVVTVQPVAAAVAPAQPAAP